MVSKKYKCCIGDAKKSGENGKRMNEFCSYLGGAR